MFHSLHVVKQYHFTIHSLCQMSYLNILITEDPPTTETSMFLKN
jgi:hypothetical protein